MNYRHAFHAGNFADVFKHSILTRILVYLCRKDAAFRYIDTHAGLGLYDLSSDEAKRTGEWHEGIGRIVADPPTGEVAELLAPYLAQIPVTAEGGILEYPGSPCLAQQLTRKQDRLSLCELHERDVRKLGENIGRDKRVKVLHLDGYTGLKAFVPPVERRGLVLIDPPFEDREEFARLAAAVTGAHAKWPTGTYAIWYPVKNIGACDDFAGALVAAGIRKMLRIELRVASASNPGLSANGMIIINPPHVLEVELKVLLPVLTKRMACDGEAAWRLVELAGE